MHWLEATPFTGHTLSLSGITPGSVGGIAYVSDEKTSHVGANLGPALVIFDNVSGVNQLVSTSSFTPQSGMTVVTNVFITGLTSTDSIGLTSFIQQFAQNGPPVLTGDYNTNGTVDAADYVVWRNNLGSGTSLPNDDTPGVGPDDYNRWRTNFGRTAGSGSGAIVAVPEPATLILMVLAAKCLNRWFWHGSVSMATRARTGCASVGNRAVGNGRDRSSRSASLTCYTPPGAFLTEREFESSQPVASGRLPAIHCPPSCE